MSHSCRSSMSHAGVQRCRDAAFCDDRLMMPIADRIGESGSLSNVGYMGADSAAWRCRYRRLSFQARIQRLVSCNTLSSHSAALTFYCLYSVAVCDREERRISHLIHLYAPRLWCNTANYCATVYSSFSLFCLYLRSRLDAKTRLPHTFNTQVSLKHSSRRVVPKSLAI